MANRAYLYSVDKKPTDQNRGKLNIKGLSEWNWQIPPSYLMLISGTPELSKSLIWKSDEKVAVLGKYDKGIKNLELLFNLVRNNNVQFLEVYNRISRESLDFLESNKVRQNFIILEGGELFEMGNGMSENAASYVLEDSQNMLKAVREGNIEAINKYVSDDITTHWEDLLGMNNWSDILYFNFNLNQN